MLPSSAQLVIVMIKAPSLRQAMDWDMYCVTLISNFLNGRIIYIKVRPATTRQRLGEGHQPHAAREHQEQTGSTSKKYASTIV